MEIVSLFLCAQEPIRDRKKVKHVKHDGNITLDDVIEIARIMKPRSMARKLEVFLPSFFFGGGGGGPKTS